MRQVPSKDQGEYVLLGLRPRHRAFVAAYLSHHNATLAVLDVYHCSYNAAKVQGSRLMAREDVLRAISHGEESAELIARCAAADVMKQVIQLHRSSETKAPVQIRAARLILEAAGMVQRRRRR